MCSALESETKTNFYLDLMYYLCRFVEYLNVIAYLLLLEYVDRWDKHNNAQMKFTATFRFNSYHEEVFLKK